MRRFVLVSAVVLLSSCQPSGEAPPEDVPDEVDDEASAALDSALREALSFHASFDGGPDADYARGDGTIYTATSYQELGDAQPGIGNPDVRLVPDEGRFGDALHFTKKNERAIFFRAADNVAYTPTDWSGTISFWLSLDPATDLAPGYCDPIQITDSRYNDGAVWVDFTDENPRQFRLGIFGDLRAWNPDEIQGDNPVFDERLVVVESPPFYRGRWTHVVITYSGLGSDAGGTAKLYLNGEVVPKTMTDVNEPFTWDDPGSIRLGVNYVGLFDELSLFDRALSADEVEQLHTLRGGASELHP